MYREPSLRLPIQTSEKQPRIEASEKLLTNRRAEFTAAYFRERYGGRTENEEISLYVKNLLQRLLKPNEAHIEAIVCARMGDINAFATQNGKIFVSEELIDFCQSEDELLFVLGHELNHIRNKHHEKQQNLVEVSARKGFIEAQLDEAALSRTHEYHADVKSFVDLNDLGINPYGAISFTQRYRDHNRYKSAGITHGEGADRLVNLFWGTRLIDLNNLTPELGEPIPQKYHVDTHSRILNEKEQYTRIVLDTGYFDDVRRYRNSLSTLREMGLLESQTVAATLYERHRAFHEKKKDKTLSPGARSGLTIRDEKNNELMEIFLRKVEAEVHGVPNVSMASKDFANAVLLDLFYKLPLGADYARQTELICAEYAERAFGNTYTVAEIINLLNDTLQISEKIGLYYARDPQSLVLGIAEMLRRSADSSDGESFDFSKFKLNAEKILTVLTEHYEKRGLVELSKDSMEECRALLQLHVVFELSDDEADKITRNIFDIHRKFDDEINHKRVLLGLPTLQRKTVTDVIKDASAVNRMRVKDSETHTTEDELINLSADLEQVLAGVDTQEKVLLKRVENKISVLISLHTVLDSYAENPQAFSKEEVMRVINLLESCMTDISSTELPEALEKSLWAEINHTIKILYTLDGFSASLHGDVKETFDVLRKISLTPAMFNYHIWKLSENNQLPTITNKSDFDFLSQFTSTAFTADEYNKSYKFSLEEPDEMMERYLAYSVFTILNAQIKDGAIVTPSEIFREFYLLSRTTKANKTVFYTHSAANADYDDTSSPLSRTTWQEGAKQKRIFFEYVFKNFKFSLEQPEDLKNLLLITEYVDNPSIIAAAKRGIFKRILDGFSFDEGFEVVIQSKNRTPLDVLELFLQKKARTHTEMEKCHDEIFKRYLTDEEGSDTIKTTIISELFAQNMSPKEKLSLLEDLLETQRDDLKLRQRILLAFLSARKPDTYNAHLDSRTPESVLKDLYRSTDEERYFILQKLFLGKDGIFDQEQTRLTFVDYFFDSHVEASDDNREILEALKQILKKVFEKCAPEQGFFAIHNLLRSRILLPSEGGDNRWEKTREILLTDEKYHGKYHDESVKQILDVIFKQLKEEKRASMSQQNLEDSIASIFHDEIQGDNTQKEKLTASDLVVEIARNLGSMGTRFLQLAGQYLELTPELQDKFNQSYDAVSGQSKLTAYNTLKKNWKGFEQEVAEFGNEVGGGSMTSVYRAKTHSSEKRVIKVLNPSFRYQLEEVYKILNAVFSDLSQSDPKRYAIASHVINDLMKWIEADFSYDDFLAKDEKFRKKWDGYSKKANPYKILVPKSFGPESKRFKLEEEIEGKNLTKLEELKAEGHQPSMIVSLIIDNFIAQIKHGQVHSDVHIGNYRVTPDNKVAILDRNYFLQFDFRDQLFLFQLSGKSEDPIGIAQTVVGYFSKFDENKDIDFDKIRTELEQILLAKQEGIMSALPKVLIALRKNKVHIPLKMTLLVKNLNALKRMADAVGLSQDLKL